MELLTLEELYSKYSFKWGSRAIVFLEGDKAIKVVRLGCPEDENYEGINGESFSYQSKSSFDEEVSNFGRLEGIVPIPQLYDSWIDGEYGYIVMERLEGTLGDMDKVPEELQQSVIHLLKILMSYNISFNDITPWNIGYRSNQAYLIDLCPIEFDCRRPTKFFQSVAEDLESSHIEAPLLIAFLDQY